MHQATRSSAVHVSLAERAYRTLRDRLVLLDIEPGAPINEAQLAKELDMGRTPVREALKRLEVDHLVVSYLRQGTFAASIDIRDLAAISELRSVLEPVAARRAAELATPEQRESLRATASEIEAMIRETPTRRTLIEHDLIAHRRIYGVLDNTHLHETLERLDNLATRLWWTVLDRMPDVGEHVAEHVALLHAIAEGDADRAATLALEHVANFEASVRRAV
ncbi:GntR family transcriptional regulator [Pseudoclavibacter endophyticus]|uniref:GntR family transcriptional regulator n=1 Tax=Pseudoclavibacter endophyticus TaxID=1778590 RepID=A0A6H9WTF0_9MICO|nr:GntR family transcriptional regulator [Pseudoclavibacter endophyticus]KAB1649550.1 GntR family transcriptional regulator [Pseudoclavibacter endophyticus]GGA61715.1 GntR family transcriptional regulator [Pseudoclavibacter endophyticus]